MSSTNAGKAKPKTKDLDIQSSNTIKDPDEWKTGDEEITGAQRSYLQTLADEAGEEVDLDLTKAEASKLIEELQQKTGRGVDH
jgi:Protein of unknown function (DUF3072)